MGQSRVNASETADHPEHPDEDLIRALNPDLKVEIARNPNNYRRYVSNRLVKNHQDLSEDHRRDWQTPLPSKPKRSSSPASLSKKSPPTRPGVTPQPT